MCPCLWGPLMPAPRGTFANWQIIPRTPRLQHSFPYRKPTVQKLSYSCPCSREGGLWSNNGYLNPYVMCLEALGKQFLYRTGELFLKLLLPFLGTKNESPSLENVGCDGVF